MVAWKTEYFWVLWRVTFIYVRSMPPTLLLFIQFNVKHNSPRLFSRSVCPSLLTHTAPIFLIHRDCDILHTFPYRCTPRKQYRFLNALHRSKGRNAKHAAWQNSLSASAKHYLYLVQVLNSAFRFPPAQRRQQSFALTIRLSLFLCRGNVSRMYVRGGNIGEP